MNTKKHRKIVERILGHNLPQKAVIHHFDGKQNNNENSNLVICESQAYHLFLHVRKRALDACGNVDWRKCVYCKKYDDSINMYSDAKRAFHRKCHNKYIKRNVKEKDFKKASVLSVGSLSLKISTNISLLDWNINKNKPIPHNLFISKWLLGRFPSGAIYIDRP